MDRSHTGNASCIKRRPALDKTSQSRRASTEKSAPVLTPTETISALFDGQMKHLHESLELPMEANTELLRRLAEQVGSMHQSMELKVVRIEKEVVAARLENSELVVDRLRANAERDAARQEVELLHRKIAEMEEQTLQRQEDHMRTVRELEDNASVANEKLLHREAEVMDLRAKVNELEGELLAQKPEARACHDISSILKKKADINVSDENSQPCKRSRLEEVRMQRRICFASQNAKMPFEELEALERQLTASRESRNTSPSSPMQ